VTRRMLKDVKGLGPKTLQKLQEAGVLTIEAMAIQDPKVLAARSGIPETTGAHLITEARLMLKEKMALDFVPGSIAARVLDVPVFSTGIAGLDRILGGGLRAGAIYEFVGPARSGKTTICSQCCVTVQLPPEGRKTTLGKGDEYVVRGRGCPAIWLDTEKTFRPDRVSHIAERFGLDPKMTVDSISYVNAVNAHHLRWLIEERLPFVLDATNAKLIIVDSLIRHFAAEFIGRETLAPRQQILNRLLQILIEYADAYQATVIFTNQIRANPQPFGAPAHPAGGNILAYGSTYRIEVKPTKGDERKAILRDAPDLPERETTYYLRDVGLVDEDGTPTANHAENVDEVE
jgi:DNA repair protein RadA